MSIAWSASFATGVAEIDRQQNQSVLYLTHPAYRDNFPLPDFSRTFYNQHRTPEMPSGERIRQILQATDKFESRDELNCGACGYSTCREHAVAVYRGLADAVKAGVIVFGERAGAGETETT